MTVAQRILVVGPAWVGDMVMAQTLFKLLKQRSPKTVIDVLAPAWTKPLLDRMPEVNRSIDSLTRHGELRVKDRYGLAKSLRSSGYEQAIVLPNSYKSALIPFWAKIPRRTGWLGEMRYGLLNDVRYLNKVKLPLMIQQFIALGLAPDAALPLHPALPALQLSAESLALVQQKFNVQTTRPILALCPGAEFGPAKRWPPEYYAEVANAKLKAGWQVWLLGSAKDKAITDIISVLTDHRSVNLAGQTQLDEAVDLLSLATIVVTNDSGLMHVAAALSRKLIVLYGSSSPQFTPPLTQDARILKLDLPCSPCFKRECPLIHLRCLRDLQPSFVLQALAEASEMVT